MNDPSVAKLAYSFYLSLPKADNSLVQKAVGPHQIAQQVSDSQLRKITTPTLVIWGREDKILPLKDGLHIAEQIPGARAAIIDNSGHIPALEQPRAFLAALESFLTSNG